MEYSMEVPQKLEIELTYDLAIPILCISIKIKDACTPIFIPALFR